MGRNGIAAALVVLAGLALVGYGLAVGDQAIYSLDVKERVAEEDLDPDRPVVEYDYLAPDVQDSFRESLASGESVSLDGPIEFDGGYVHYRDAYYLTYPSHGDAAQTTMYFAIAGGLLLVALGGGGWYLAQRVMGGA